MSTPEQVRPGQGRHPHISVRLVSTEGHSVGKTKALSIFKAGILPTSNVQLSQLSRGDNEKLWCF